MINKKFRLMLNDFWSRNSDILTAWALFTVVGFISITTVWLKFDIMEEYHALSTLIHAGIISACIIFVLKLLTR